MGLPRPYRVVTAAVGEQRAADPPVRDSVLAVSAAFADRVHGDLAAGRWLASGPFPAVLAHEHREQAS